MHSPFLNSKSQNAKIPVNLQIGCSVIASIQWLRMNAGEMTGLKIIEGGYYLKPPIFAINADLLFRKFTILIIL